MLSLLAAVAAESEPSRAANVPIDEHIPCTPEGTTLNLKFDHSAYGRASIFTGPAVFNIGDSWPAMAGAWAIDGCQGINPTLHLDSTKEYTFLQHDESNWYHPLIFIYNWTAGNGTLAACASP